MPELEGAGVALHYEEQGEGPPVLFVHAIAADAATWSPALTELAGLGARGIAYDRRGYGASEAPEPYVATTVQEQSQDAAAVLEALGAAPALLVGDGFGALVVLELLVRRPELARAAVLAEPPLFAYVPAATEVLAAQRSALEEALRDGGPAAAVRAWFRDVDGADAARVERATRSPLGFFADYAGQASWSPSRRELRAIALPVAVVTGPLSASHVVAAAEAAAVQLPSGERMEDGDVVGAVRKMLH